MSRWAAAATRFAGGNVRNANCKLNCGGAESERAADKSVAAAALQRRRQTYLESDVRGGLRYPHELVDVIARVYADDIADFNYSFDAY